MKDQELLEVDNEIKIINEKVKNIEQITSTIESLAEHGLDSWDKYLKQKDDREKRESELAMQQQKLALELHDKIHKRSITILGICVVSVVILVLVAMFKDQLELVKIILASSLAVAGGAGITNMLTNEKKP